MTADIEVRPQLSSWCRNDDHPGCKRVQARCACSCHGVNGQQPPVNRPSVIQTSPLAERIRQETADIAERHEVTAEERPSAKDAANAWLAGNGNPAAVRQKAAAVKGVSRREWSAADKRRIVAEIAEHGVAETADKYDITPALLYKWRGIHGPDTVTPTLIVPKADRPQLTPPPVARQTGVDRTTVARPDPPEVMSPEDALGAAIGHLRWHRDHLADRLAKIDTALAALDELGET